MSAPAPREHASCLDACATRDERFAHGVAKVIRPGTGPCLPLQRPQEVTQRMVACMGSALVKRHIPEIGAAWLQALTDQVVGNTWSS